MKEITRLKKEANRLLSKGVSNIYLIVTVETISKRRFSDFKRFSPGLFWRAPTHTDIIEF